MKAEDPIEVKLDYALEMTFPASDPFTIYIPEADLDDECALAAHSSDFPAAA